MLNMAHTLLMVCSGLQHQGSRRVSQEPLQQPPRGLEDVEDEMAGLFLSVKVLQRRAKKHRKRLHDLKEQATITTSNVIVQRHRLERRVEYQEILRLTQHFSLDSILRPRKEIYCDDNRLLVPDTPVESLGIVIHSEIPGPIRTLMEQAVEANQRRLRGESVLHQAAPAGPIAVQLPPAAPLSLEQGDDALYELIFTLQLLEKHCDDVEACGRCHWLQERAERVHRKAKSGWGAYGTLIQRLRRYVDEQESPYSQFPLLRRDQPVRLLNLLGKGGFAEVWQAVRLDSWQRIAVKITDLSPEATPEEQEFILSSTCREVTLQRTLRHPHVVEMQQCFEITPSIFAASLDLCNAGSLDSCIRRWGPIQENLARAWMVQILKALVYIHEVGRVVHFDLKPLNILLHNGIVKIADFGLHQPVGSKGTVALDMRDELNQVGTVWYMPPEHLKAALLHERSEFDDRFDVWSAGVVLYEMLFQRRPFGTIGAAKGLTCDHVAAAIYCDFISRPVQFHDEINAISGTCKAFIRRLLQRVESRPRASEALLDPFLLPTESSSVHSGR